MNAAVRADFAVGIVLNFARAKLAVSQDEEGDIRFAGFT